MRSIPCEVIVPTVDARIEKRRQLTCHRIKAGDVRTFVSIARTATLREVVERGQSAMLSCDDWVTGKALAVIRLRHQAILAAIRRPQSNFLFEDRIHAQAVCVPFDFFRVMRAFD